MEIEGVVSQYLLKCGTIGEPIFLMKNINDCVRITESSEKTVNSNYYKIILKFLHISYGKNLLLKGCPFIYAKRNSRITIGDNVTVKSSFLSNLVGLYSRTIIVTRQPDAYIHIGNNVGISGATIYARKGISIGDNTAIGGNCKILDNDFHPIEAEERVKLLNDPNGGDSEAVPGKEISIGKNCFIGCNSIILKGTVLGDGCVVGAGAVVSGRFEPNSVIAGNPGRVLRVLESKTDGEN
ncbi:MAG: acyltransferase [Lachnospiraceae bacterium]|nr:acyltransferase [Lachnospiraceae bacterium]